jgi:fatty acid desaturase
VEVLGLLQRDALTPDKIIVYKKWSHYSIYIRSVFALPIVLYLFFTYWRFDLRGMRFQRRLDNA